MILGRTHLILLFDAESQCFQSRFGLYWLKQCIPFSYIFVILFLKDSSTLSTTFGCGGMLFNSHSPKPLIFCLPLVMKFVIICLSVVAVFDGLQGVGYKTGVGSF